MPTRQRRISKDGIVFREGSEVVVQVSGDSGLLDQPGVFCLNSADPADRRIYEKRFSKRWFYLPDEYDDAISTNIQNARGIFVLGANGYSDLDDEMLRRYGLNRMEYENACMELLHTAVLNLREKFPHVNLRIVDGSSRTGIDWALQQVEQDFNIPSLGFSCPRFLYYVDDRVELGPVYVAVNKAAYADLFVKSLNLLICTGGRGHTYVMDQAAVNRHQKRLHYLDVMNLITRVGSVPAIIINEKGEAVVDNAAALFGRDITYFGQADADYGIPPGGDRWDAAKLNVRSITTSVCRMAITDPGLRFRSYVQAKQ